MTDFDVYLKRAEPAERIATRPSAGLPTHLNPNDWELMPPGSSSVIDDAEADIEARGFCYFRLVP
jgi:hypothetical protein